MRLLLRCSRDVLSLLRSSNLEQPGIAASNFAIFGGTGSSLGGDEGKGREVLESDVVTLARTGKKDSQVRESREQRRTPFFEALGNFNS
jgi:hypothetical protein